MVKDLTKGNPLKSIILFCLPLMFGQFFQQFYNMVDSIIVGKFVGIDELSAVGATGSLNFMVIGFVSGVCAGFSISLSQSFGAKDYKKMRKFFSNAIYLTVILSVVLTVLTVSLTRPVLKLMNTPDNIFEFSCTYISIIFMGLTATLFYNLFATALRAIGDSVTPLILLIISSFINIALDLFFVLVLHMSVEGVAIATVIAQAISAVLAYIIIKVKCKILKIERDERAFSARLSGRLLYIGLPMALQFSITAVGSVMLQSAVNTLGSTVVAAVTIAGKIQLMLVMPAETIGLTMATYCGQNLGARRMDRVQTGVRKSILIAMVYCAIAMCGAKFFGGQMALLFIDSTEATVISYVAKFLGICAWFYPVLMLLFIYRNSLQGLGYSIPAMLAGFFELAARGAMGYFVIPKFGFTSVCFANPSAWIAADLLLIPVYYIVFFKLKKEVPVQVENE